MTSIGQVQDLTPRVVYVGGVGETNYTYPFPIIDERDVKITIDGVELTLNADYTVTGVGNETGGTLTLSVATVGGEAVTLFRETPIDRLVDYANNGDFRPETVNNDFDRIILMIQELSNNSISVYDTDETVMGGPICFANQVTFKNLAPLSEVTPTLSSHLLRLGDIGSTNANLDSIFKKLSVTTTKGDTVLTLTDSFQKAIVFINGVAQLETSGAYMLGPLANQITLSEAIESDDDVVEVWINSLFLFDEKSLRNYSLLSDAQTDPLLAVGQTFTTIDYAVIGDGGGAKYKVLAPQVVDEMTDVTAGSGNVLVNISHKLDSAMAGVAFTGADETAKLQSIINKLSPEKELFISSSDFSLSGFLLFNNGYKKVSHTSDSKVTWLGAGELSTTTKAIYGINLDASGIKTNETSIGVTTAETDENESTFTLDTTIGISIGSIIRVDKHVCRVESINGNVIQTDRALPIPVMVIGSGVYTLDIPNIGSEFSGPSLLQFAPSTGTKNYGFGVIAANCFNTKVNNFYGLHNSSKVCELLYCADSEASDIQQYEPADINAGQGYALRISNGNDNFARRIQSSKGRHCVDLTFTHRNKAFDCKDFEGNQASYLTHFNGSRHNEFHRCELHNCDFGIYLSADAGDFNNHFYDGLVNESRGAYRPVSTSRYYRTRFINSIVASSRDCFVPRANGLSVFDATDCTFDTINAFCNVDEDCLANIRGGTFKLNAQDDLFRGVDSGIPGAPTTDANVTIKFFNVAVDAPVRMGRNNINAKVTFERCNIDYYDQPFGEDMGNQEYLNCSITDKTGGVYLVTVGSGNECKLIDSELFNVTLPFRFFTGFPATGHVTFGDNTLLDGSSYNSNGLTNMSWLTTGYVSIPLARTNDGSPDDGSIVYIDSDVTTDPFKRKRVSSSWVDWII